MLPVAEINCNMLTDAAKSDYKEAFSLTKQVWLMGKQFRIVGGPLQKELLLIKSLLIIPELIVDIVPGPVI